MPEPRRAVLDFFIPLFSRLNAHVADDGTMRSIAIVQSGSPMASEERPLKPWWTSTVTTAAFISAVDHSLTLDRLFRGGEVAVSGVWALSRGVVEGLAQTLWLMSGPNRSERQTRTLRLWHDDFRQRERWLRAVGKSDAADVARRRQTEILAIAQGRRITAAKVKVTPSMTEMIKASATIVGLPPAATVSHWNAASGFAHGRVWPQLHLTSPTKAVLLPVDDGVGVSLALDEDQLIPLVTFAVAMYDEARQCALRWQTRQA